MPEQIVCGAHVQACPGLPSALWLVGVLLRRTVFPFSNKRLSLQKILGCLGSRQSADLRVFLPVLCAWPPRHGSRVTTRPCAVRAAEDHSWLLSTRVNCPFIFSIFC